MSENVFDPIGLFSSYMKVTGVPELGFEKAPDPALQDKKLGIINGGSWITLWSTYFGGRALPGVKLINTGNEAVQLNFMAAHHRGESCPPQVNIDLFLRHAEDLVQLQGVDAILISCSTMNRAYRTVQEAMARHGVPVIQIDEAMMKKAVEHGGRILIVATHGPTVDSTRALLEEAAERFEKSVTFTGATVEQAFELLGRGDIRGHNEAIARAIRNKQAEGRIDIVVLAQLSMTVFKLSYSDSQKTFGVSVLTSGETGFERAGEVLKGLYLRSPSTSFGDPHGD